MAALDDFITSIDAYMAKTKGKSYIANKIVALFEDKDSVFNVKGTVMAGLAKRMKDFADQIYYLNSPNGIIITVKNMFQSLSGRLFDLNNILGDLWTDLEILNDAVNLATKQINSARIKAATTIPTTFVPPPSSNSTTYSTTNNTSFGMKNLPTPLQFYKMVGGYVNIRVSDFSQNALTKLSRLIVATQNSAPILSNPTTTANNNLSKETAKLVRFLAKQSERNAVRAERQKNKYEQLKKDKDEKGGILSTIFKIIKSTLYFFGGVFIIGQIKKYLDSSETGKLIKTKLHNVMNVIFDKLHDLFKDNNFGEHMKKSLEFIHSISSTIYEKIKGAIKGTDSSEIGKNLSTIFKAFGQEIYKPLVATLKQIFDKLIHNIPYKEIASNTMDFIWNDVLKPLFNQIKKDLMAGNYGGALMDVLGGVLILRFFPGIKSLTKLFGKTASLLGPGPLGMTGIVLAAIASYEMVNDAYKKLIESQHNITANWEQMTKDVQNEDKKIFEKRIQEIDKKPKTEATALERKIEEINQQLTEQTEQNTKFQKENSEEKERQLKSLSWYEKIYDALPKALRGIDQSTNEKFNNYSDNAQKSYRQSTQSLFNERDELVKKLEETKNIKSIQPHDAIIVEPHSKDQVVMAKKDGPIDLVMKDMAKKLDILIGIMGEGCASIINATMSSGSSITQAVMATGSSGQSSTPSFGGNDHIRDQRDRSARAIEKFHR